MDILSKNGDKGDRNDFTTAKILKEKGILIRGQVSIYNEFLVFFKGEEKVWEAHQNKTPNTQKKSNVYNEHTYLTEQYVHFKRMLIRNSANKFKTVQKLPQLGEKMS